MTSFEECTGVTVVWKQKKAMRLVSVQPMLLGVIALVFVLHAEDRVVDANDILVGIDLASALPNPDVSLNRL